MPEGFGAGIGIVGSEPTQRREHKDGGGPGSEMQPGRGWASAGPPPGEPRGWEACAGGRWHGAGMARSWEPNPLASTLQRNFSSFGGKQCR